MNLVLHSGHEESHGQTPGDFLVGPLVSSDALDQGDGEGVELVRLMRLVHDGQWNPEAQPLQITHFFAQSNDFGQKVYLTEIWKRKCL